MTFNVDDLEDPQKPHKERDHSEFKIHLAIIEHITGRKTGQKAFNVFVHHIFQGRDAKDGFFLKLMGVVPGVADILILWRSKCSCGVSKVGIGFLEVKRPDGTQSTPQRKFEGICHWLGVPYAIVKSVTQAHDALIVWGCPANHSAIKEPDCRTKSQKLKDASEIYKR